MVISLQSTFEWEAMRSKKPSCFIKYPELLINSSEQTHGYCDMLSMNLARIQASCHLEEPTRPPLRHCLTPLFKIAIPSLLTASLLFTQWATGSHGQG